MFFGEIGLGRAYYEKDMSLKGLQWALARNSDFFG